MLRHYSIALRAYPPPCHYFANDGSWVSLAVIARIVGTMDMWRLPHGSIVKERLERSPVRLMPSATEKRTITTHHSEPRHASRAQGTVADSCSRPTAKSYSADSKSISAVADTRLGVRSQRRKKDRIAKRIYWTFWTSICQYGATVGRGAL